MAQRFDFSDLDKVKADPFEDLNEEAAPPPKSAWDKYQDFMQPKKVDSQGRPMVETIIGRLPQDMPEFRPGTPESKKLLEEMINVGAGAPGIKMVGAAAGKGASILKNLVQSAFKSKAPYQEAATKAAQEYEAASQAAAPVKPGIYRTPMSELQDVESQIGKHINAEGEHGVRAAHAIKGRVGDIEKYWSDSYKQFEDKIKDAKFQMPETALSSLGYDMDAVMARLKQGADPKKVIQIMEKESANAENPFYKQLLSKAPTSKDTNAGDFLAKYRDFRDTMGGLKQDLKSERYGSIEKEKINEAIQKGKDMEGQIKDVLNQGLGEHKPEYDWLMKGYSEQVFPLRKNPLVRAAKQGKMPDNILKALRTDEPGMGVMRGIVKQDPELLRNVIGQRYMAKAGEIHAPNELAREYLDEMPEFKNLLSKREDVLKRTAERKDITLQQKIDAENKLNEITTAKSKAIKKLLIGAGVVGAPYAGVKGTQMFTGD